MRIFNYLTLLHTVFAAASLESASIGSLVVTPIDYDTYGETIDLQLVRYNTEGDVFFYDTSVKTVSNQTKTVKDGFLLSGGQFSVNNDQSYYLQIDATSGFVSVSSDNSSIDGIFYINGGNLYYNYHDTFVACEDGANSSNYTLIWRGASSVAVCENDWVLVHLKAYGSSNGQLSEYFPNNYATEVASTATENTATTTATVGATGVVVTNSSASSSGAAAKIGSFSAVGLFGLAMWVM